MSDDEDAPPTTIAEMSNRELLADARRAYLRNGGPEAIDALEGLAAAMRSFDATAATHVNAAAVRAIERTVSVMRAADSARHDDDGELELLAGCLPSYCPRPWADAIGRAGTDPRELEWDVVQRMVDWCQFDLATLDGDGATMLVHAARAHDADGIWRLVHQMDMCADDTSSRDGIAALHVVARDNRIELIALLDLLGADVNVRDASERAPLAHATDGGAHHAIVALLGIDGIKVDARDTVGDTALHIAARADDQRAVRLLVGAGGADTHAVNDAAEVPHFSTPLVCTGSTSVDVYMQMIADAESRQI